jgi:hypothetical protein
MKDTAEYTADKNESGFGYEMIRPAKEACPKGQASLFIFTYKEKTENHSLCGMGFLVNGDSDKLEFVYC